MFRTQDALAVFLQRVDLEEQTARIDYEELEQAMGEKLVVLQNAPTEYATCVL
jgi:nitrogen fixation protein